MTVVHPLLRGLLFGAALAVLLSMAGATKVRAQAPEDAPALEVTVGFREANARIGDRVRLEVVVRHAADVVVTVPRPDLPDAESLGDGQVTVATQDDGSQVTTTSFLYQVFALGELESGPVTVRWIREDGRGGQVVEPGARLTLVSVRAPGDEALRPLKPTLAVEGAPPAWIRPAAVTAVVIVVVAVLVLLAKAVRGRGVEGPEPEPRDLPERHARERLGALHGAALPDEAEFQRFYGTIAAVVREYLQDRFGFNATALTSTELEARMRSHGVDRWQARLVSGLLERCDRAVYARHYPDPASADHDLTVAYEIVELSRPRALEDAGEPEAVAT